MTTELEYKALWQLMAEVRSRMGRALDMFAANSDLSIAPFEKSYMDCAYQLLFERKETAEEVEIKRGTAIEQFNNPAETEDLLNQKKDARSAWSSNYNVKKSEMLRELDKHAQYLLPETLQILIPMNAEIKACIGAIDKLLEYSPHTVKKAEVLADLDIVLPVDDSVSAINLAKTTKAAIANKLVDECAKEQLVQK